MPSHADDLELLRQEFSAEDGSFLLQLRVELHWDRHAFSELEQAMRRACARLESRDFLDRWLAEGYWYLSDFVPGHTSHPDFPRPEPAEYYKAAIRRLRDLQNWFVTGRSPYLDSHQWPDLLRRRVRRQRTTRPLSAAAITECWGQIPELANEASRQCRCGEILDR